MATHVVNKKLHVIIEFLCQNVDVYETLVRLRGATVAQFSLADTVLPSIATFDFWGSSLVKNRLFIHFLKTNLKGIFWCKIYVFFSLSLFLIPGRRQLPKLRKFPSVVSRCRLHHAPRFTAIQEVWMLTWTTRGSLLTYNWVHSSLQLQFL